MGYVELGGCFLVAFFMQCEIILFSKRTHCFLDKGTSSKPQRLHNGDIPRCGGIAIFLSLLIVLLAMGNSLGLKLLLVSSPAFFIGSYEDFRHDIHPYIRIGVMVLSVILAIFLMHVLIKNLGYFKMYKLPIFIFFIFTVFCIVGVTNAMNIIDGLNGLSSGVFILSMISFAVVAYNVQDTELLKVILILIAIVFGFIVLNFPKAKIFLGDGGAYFLGFILAVLSILLVNRNPTISPWFPLTVLIYPIWEVIFSIYRRRFVKNIGPTSPDKLHLHSLLSKRIIRSNPWATLIIWLSIIAFDILAVFFRNKRYELTILCLIFIILYLMVYNTIVNFEVEKYL